MTIVTGRLKVDIFDSSSCLSGPVVVFTIKIKSDFVIPILLILHLLSRFLLVLHVLFVLAIRVVIGLIIIFILTNIKRVVAVLGLFPDHLILNKYREVSTDEHNFSFLIDHELDFVNEVLPSNINFQILLLLIFEQQIGLPGRIQVGQFKLVNVNNNILGDVALFLLDEFDDVASQGYLFACLIDFLSQGQQIFLGRKRIIDIFNLFQGVFKSVSDIVVFRDGQIK